MSILVRCWECGWKGERADAAGSQTGKLTDLSCPVCWGVLLVTAANIEMAKKK